MDIKCPACGLLLDGVDPGMIGTNALCKNRVCIAKKFPIWINPEGEASLAGILLMTNKAELEHISPHF